ncbi:MAG: M23 family metallopeptidase [Spirochaetes bacterium]|nr:M23 family metallopeptidase [Spirochaetota bacterium]
MNGFPISNYTVWQIKKFTGIFIIILIIIFLAGNLLTAIFKDKIEINPDSYILKNGFPLFTSAEEYIKLIKSYPYDFGVQIKIYKMIQNESYWNVAMRNNISMDTLIAANPFLDSLLAKQGIEIVLPSEDGVLMPMDNLADIWRMSRIVEYEDSVKGSYVQSIFKLFSLDDIRFVFFKGAVPEIVNDSLEKLLAMKKIFQSPLAGRFTSLYGERFDPFAGGFEFHNGIDICAKMNDPIYPAREGIVSFTGWRHELGLAVIIQHLDGYETTYGHCSAINVKPGESVIKKDIIGRVGSTGRSTGPHLHFMIKRHGQLINPLIFIW